MKSIRQALQSAKASVSDKGEEARRTEEVLAQSQRVQRALDAYCLKQAEANTSARELFQELAVFYPDIGPLAPALIQFSVDDPASPWSVQASSARAEAMKLNLATPTAGLGAIAGRITEAIRQRELLHAEANHYQDKVGRLQQEFVNAKEKDKAKAKEKLDENKGKLSTAMDSYAAKKREVDAALASLDSDIVAVLTPTVTQLTKTVQTYHADSAAFISGGLEGVHAAVAAQRRASATAMGSGGARPSMTGGTPLGAAAAAAAASATPSGGAGGPALQFTPVAVPMAGFTGGAPSAAAAAAAPPVVSGSRSSNFPVRGLADYAAQQDGDLSFGKKELFLITERAPDGWWKGRRGEEIGVCPSNFVAEAKGLVPSSTMAAAYAFETDDASEVPLAAGDRVTLFAPPGADDAWVLVQHAASGLYGYVPLGYLKPAEDGVGKAAAAKAAAAPAAAIPAAAAAVSASPAAAPPVMNARPEAAPVAPARASAPRAAATTTVSAAAAPAPAPAAAAAAAPAPSAGGPTPESSGIPAGSPFWSDTESYGKYQRLLKMGLGVEQLAAKMRMDGADPSVLYGGAAGAGAGAPAAAKPAAAAPAPAPVAAPAPAPAAAAPVAPARGVGPSPQPAASKPLPPILGQPQPLAGAAAAAPRPGPPGGMAAAAAALGGVVGRQPGPAMPAAAAAPPVAAVAAAAAARPQMPVPAAARPTAAASAPAAAAAPAKAKPAAPAVPGRGAAGAEPARPAAAPGGLLAGIQGFDKKKLAKATTVEKTGLPTGAPVGAAGGAGRAAGPAAGSPAVGSPAQPAAPRPAGGGGLSMLEEMRLRQQARRGST